MKKSEYVACAMNIVLRLQKCGCLVAEDYDTVVDWFDRALALVCAYHGEENENSPDRYERMRHVFESYNKDDSKCWTVAAFLMANDIGDEYALSIYERDCVEHDSYIRMGEQVKAVVDMLDSVGE